MIGNFFKFMYSFHLISYLLLRNTMDLYNCKHTNTCPKGIYKFRRLSGELVPKRSAFVVDSTPGGFSRYPAGLP